MLDYCILVNSCDAYRDVWPFFFYLLKKNWKADEIPEIYLNTESQSYYEDGLDVVTLNHVDKCAWGERLLAALARIEHEYVLMMLEDFYYESPIKVDIIDECVKRMSADRSILSFQLVPASEVYRREVKPENRVIPGFALRERKGTYTFIAGPTLWRKSDLINLTKQKDSPWDFEWYGSFRTQLYGKKIYCWESFDNPVFDYDIAHGGAVHGGKWVGYKMRELEKKFDYELDYGDREVVEDWILDGAQKQVAPQRKRNKVIRIILSKYEKWKYTIKEYENVLYGLQNRVLKIH